MSEALQADARDSAQVVDSIEEMSEAVRNAARELTALIDEAETQLGRLPGRVDARCFGVHPDAGYQDPLELGLRFHRQGKRWILSYCTYHPMIHDDPDHPIDWKPLQEASLRIKMAAVPLLPDLLAAIEKSQERLVHDLQEAANDASAFLASLKKREKGVKSNGRP